MAAKKEPIGFATPARELEHALAQIQGELSEKKANWESVRDGMLRLKNQAWDGVKTGNASPDQYTLLSTTIMGTMIAILGVELTETHDRLAKVEKAIKELKLGK
ncbi:MAG: hypothetical protein NTV59_07010 [Chloroflexi bacterium]|nr:hypothetical protein [Chloroflexota bacterium]